jgi:hypothetical protein
MSKDLDVLVEVEVCPLTDHREQFSCPIFVYTQYY